MTTLEQKMACLSPTRRKKVEARNDLLEILDDQMNARSTLITSQLPVKHWHEYIGEPTLADAILDRLVHNAHKLTLKGESMRKTKNTLTDREHLE